MKILHINTLSNGGAAIASIRLHKALLNQSINSNFLTLQKLSFTLKNSHSHINNSYKRYIVLFLFKLHRKIINNFNYLLNLQTGIFWSPKTYFRIHKNQLILQTDIIHLHWITFFLDYPTFFKNNKKPIIWTLHDMQPFTGGYSYKTDFPFRFYAKKLENYKNIKKNTLLNQDIHIVALCKRRLELSKNSEIFNRFPHYLIPNGINTRVFKPYNKLKIRELFKLPIEKKVILFVANQINQKIKGYSFLKEALLKLNKEKLVLLTVGNSANFVSTIPYIRSLGEIEDESKLAQVYSAADLFVIPSIEDNLPNTVIESISCGTPVVGFDIGGIPDMIVDGKNGFLVESIDATLLANKIEAALLKEWDKEWIRADAVKRFDEKVQATRYIELYNKILSQS